MKRLLAALVICVMVPVAGMAHEIRPAIADVRVEADRVSIKIQLALEASVAGLDLRGLQDTDAAAQAGRYDRMRAMTPADLEAELRRVWPDIVAGLTLYAGNAVLIPEILAVTIPEVGDQTLARDSHLTLAADLPDGDSPVIFGWAARYGPLVVRQGQGDDAYSAYLTDGALSAEMPRDAIASEAIMTSFLRYIRIGFEHIVPKGLDHILFVLGLFFFSLHLRPLLYQVTAFTVAHTVTLALAVLGYVSVSPAIVEPLIAASIVYVAVENVFFARITPWRTAVVFGFGLLHGLGFASVLGEIGLNPARFITGLIGFNLGVELGQLAVILGGFLTVGLWFGRKPWYRSAVAIPASIGIALVGAYWFVERVWA